MQVSEQSEMELPEEFQSFHTVKVSRGRHFLCGQNGHCYMITAVQSRDREQMEESKKYRYEVIRVSDMSE